jgi:hypothetical protein
MEEYLGNGKVEGGRRKVFLATYMSWGNKIIVAPLSTGMQLKRPSGCSSESIRCMVFGMRLTWAARVL